MADGGGLIRLRSPKPTRPSYKTGYAKSASESAYPELWDGLVGAWVPSFGSTGTSLKDISRVGYEGSIAVDATSPLDTAWTSEGLNFTGRTFPDVRADLNPDRRSDTAGSVFASFKARTLQQGAVWWLGDNASNEDYAALEIRAGGEQRFQVRTSTGYVFVRETTGTLLVSVDEWQTIAGTQDGTGTYGPRTYINGTETGNEVVSPIVELNADGWLSSGSSNVNDITLGYYGRTSPRAEFDGIIGVVLQYNRALSPSEIKYLHVDPLAPFRQRRSIPVGVTTEQTESHPANGLIRLRSPKPTNEVDWDDPLNKGLVAWMPMGQNGRPVVDLVSGGIGVPSGGPGVDLNNVTKQWGVDLDGSDDYITIPHHPIQNTITDQLTVAWWSKISTGDAGGVIAKYNTSNNRSWSVKVTESVGTAQKVSLYISDDGVGNEVQSYSGSSNLDEWQHHVLSWNAGVGRVLYNGDLSSIGTATHTVDTSVFAGTADLVIGARYNALELLDGQVSDIRVYNRALSDEEMRQIYEASVRNYPTQFKRRSILVGVTAAVAVTNYPLWGMELGRFGINSGRIGVRES